MCTMKAKSIIELGSEASISYDPLQTIHIRHEETLIPINITHKHTRTFVHKHSTLCGLSFMYFADGSVEQQRQVVNSSERAAIRFHRLSTGVSCCTPERQRICGTTGVYVGIVLCGSEHKHGRDRSISHPTGGGVPSLFVRLATHNWQLMMYGVCPNKRTNISPCHAHAHTYT